MRFIFRQITMANNVEQLAVFVVAAYLETNTNKTISTSFKKNKKITHLGPAIPTYNKLIDIINFYNTKAPAKDRLVLPAKAAGKNEITPATNEVSNTDSNEKIKNLLRDLENEVAKVTVENSDLKNKLKQSGNQDKKTETAPAKDPVKSAVSKEAPSKMEESSSSDESDDDTEMKDATGAKPVDLQKKTTETKKK